MNLIKITDLTNQFGLTSRSLRYYEQAGLIQSVRSQYEKYRFYDEENVERLKQIIVLRKMQIPIKDIIRIYESEDMSVVVQTFVDRIDAIDGEINALSEMKRITNEFLQTMIKNGIKRISALPLLYEEMDRHLKLLNNVPGDAHRKPVTFEELAALSEKLDKPLDIIIVDLPSMRVISSYLKANQQTTDTQGFSRFVQAGGIAPGKQGHHERFEFQTDMGDVEIRRVPDDFINNSEYLDYLFSGGLFAAANVYLDEDLGERFRSLIKGFDENKYYQIDYAGDGSLRHAAMLENLISPDDQRELVLLLVPVKKRLADPALFERPKEIAPDAINIKEIEAQNPVLWMVDVPLDKLTPINNPHYQVLDNGEVEYTGWISTRVLNTNVAIKLPFRVDIEFRLEGNDERFGYGDSEGSLIFYHGEDTGYFAGGHLGQMGFGVNMGNYATMDAWVSAPRKEESLSFRQPVFRDFYNFPGRGKIKAGGYNRVIWIVGDKHLSVIINGEVRYCGTNFPYMTLDLSREEAKPIVIGSNGQGMKYFKSIRVSQLAGTKKNIIKQGELTMVIKQSNNIISIIHRLITDEYGENYWFNGCAKYVMECLGEKDYDYQFFAGLTGDVFAQYYPFDHFRGEGVTGYKFSEGSETYLREGVTRFVKEMFKKCGYAATYVTEKELRKNTQMYLQTLIAYIDKGVPVISWGHGGPPVGVFIGYEDYGKILLYITGNNNGPERMPLEQAIAGETECGGWIFVGEKKESRELAKIYREAICDLPKLLTTRTKYYCFGAEAFRAWANDIENDKFDDVNPEAFDHWALYTSYVCGLATNGSCCHEFLKRARELNPDMGFLEDISRLYQKTADMWNNQNGEDLEALGGGFNVTLEVLQDKDKRKKIAEKIRECAEVMDEAVRVLNENLKGIK
ncbi:MAG: MerR family transcriptional regulator [Ruminiclostridium sp.]|nr:MerR family transcriptional regulator [Ruminiclostridium sp.]